MKSSSLKATISLITEFYDAIKVGSEGWEGYRKSTALRKLESCVVELDSFGLLSARHTIFADLGCADGRVNILLSYFVRSSIGIEIDPNILAEFIPRERELAVEIQRRNLVLPPNNIALFRQNSLEPSTYLQILPTTGTRFSDIDIFYAYITLHDLFAERIAREAKSKALYLVYGFSKVWPHYRGLELLISDVASQGIAALYIKS